MPYPTPPHILPIVVWTSIAIVNQNLAGDFHFFHSKCIKTNQTATFVAFKNCLSECSEEECYSHIAAHLYCCLSCSVHTDAWYVVLSCYCQLGLQHIRITPTVCHSDDVVYEPIHTYFIALSFSSSGKKMQTKFRNYHYFDCIDLLAPEITNLRTCGWASQISSSLPLSPCFQDAPALAQPIKRSIAYKHMLWNIANTSKRIVALVIQQ